MKEKKYLIFSTVILIALLVFGVSYSFYKARIEGDTKSISLKTKGIYLLYKGDLNLVSGYIEPGWSVTKTFTIENQSSSEEKYNIYIKDLVNTFETSGYLQYKITSTNTGYNMTGYKDIPKSSIATDTVLAYNVTVAAKTSQVYTIELRYLDTDNDQSADMNKTLSGLLMIKEGSYPTLSEVILRDNPTISERTDFSITNTANTTGTIYQTNKTEDGSTVYYYSGNTTNNWVKFAGFYWRIIRTNEDGSTRLLYSGTSHDTTSGYIGKSAYNSTYNDPIYVGYMYGTTGSLANNRTNTNDSTIKTVIDTWYQNNLLNNYDKYINKNAMYCNDRSVPNNDYSTSVYFDYGSMTRLNTNYNHLPVPTYKCGGNGTDGLFESAQAIADKFSASTTGGGNGQLKYPIAMMTIDELSFAGGLIPTPLNSPYAWYYTNSQGESITGGDWWWSLSPRGWSGSNAYAWSVYGSGSPGLLSDYNVRNDFGVRPAISLASCVGIKSGYGTPESPYVVDYEGSCN